MNAEQFFHEQIPLTRAMDLRVRPTADGSFVVEAPVSSNHNHLKTAFGGSINAAAVLAAYGLIWRDLARADVEIVVRDSSIRYLRPIHETIRAVCFPPNQQVWRTFQADLETKNKALLRLAASVLEGEEVAAEFKATFLARRRVAN